MRRHQISSIKDMRRWVIVDPAAVTDYGIIF